MFVVSQDALVPGLRFQDWPRPLLDTLRRGAVIPAHPLALDERRKLDAVSQRALSRYYIDAGARGLAVGVHTTQFQIREAGLGPYCNSLPRRRRAGRRHRSS